MESSSSEALSPVEAPAGGGAAAAARRDSRRESTAVMAAIMQQQQQRTRDHLRGTLTVGRSHAWAAEAAGSAGSLRAALVRRSS
eukprot:546263-Rhodomonas_salina.5